MIETSPSIVAISKALSAEFPQASISWRAQSLTKDGTKALALAYIDARDVMNRLDEVMGIDRWKDRYEFNAGTAICYLSLCLDGEWIEKADGAGSTDVEAEKGQISDAFKRAAVRWQIGRYLYDMPSVWVPCESYEKNGKYYWSKWKEDPWGHVKSKPSPSKAPEKTQQAPKTGSKAQPNRDIYSRIETAIRLRTNADDLNKLWNRKDTKAAVVSMPEDWQINILSEFSSKMDELLGPPDNYVPPNFDDLPYEPDNLTDDQRGLIA